MAVRSKGDAEQLRRLARALYFSNETVFHKRIFSELTGYLFRV